MAKQLEIPGTAKRGRKKIRTDAEVREQARIRVANMRQRRQNRLEALEALRERVREYLDGMAAPGAEPWSSDLALLRQEMRQMLADLEGLNQ